MNSTESPSLKNNTQAKRVDGVDPESVQASVAALIVQVGERAQLARKGMRLSRRELSEISGVSPRYIARLEVGEGNISIGLLYRLARALERPIDWFVGKENHLNSDIERVLVGYRHADAKTRASVLQTLTPKPLREQKKHRICLIGLRGAGKSSLGAKLGEVLSLPFIEVNQEIEHSAGMPVADVMAMYGEDGYRKLEADRIKHIITTHEHVVLAVAGGVVEQPDTYKQVLERFHTVWLKATPSEHMERVRAQGDLRPMEGRPKAMEKLRQILLSRESLYAQAEYHMDTSGKTINASLAELRLLVKANGIVS